MDNQTKIEIRNSFAAYADTYLRSAEENIRAAQIHVKHYKMGCTQELDQCLLQLETVRKTLWLLRK